MNDLIAQNPETILDAMNKDERSLLLFLETQAVDHCGLVGTAHMNAPDRAIAKKWADDQFIRFSRLLSKYLLVHNGKYGAVVELGPVAWQCAAIERQRRASRVQSDKVKESLAHFASLPSPTKEIQP
jgi:hypothetical protein